MCGIAGIVSAAGGPPPSPAALRRMCQAVVHRGPDEEGRGIEDGVAFGVRRLAVIDVRGGHQPLLNEGGDVRAIFNGEIYNFRELRRVLEAKGHRFRSQSDGEVIPHLWEEHGSQFPGLLNGMFAIALHDMRERRLVLVRDRVGVKPLFYAVANGYVVFGSEVKSLLASGLVAPRLDLDALQQFLCWEYVPAPGTLFAGIKKLEAGSILDVDLNSLRCRSSAYWDVPLAGSAADGHVKPHRVTELEEAVDAKLAEAVKRQLVSDVPLGAFLSGGVDSSLMVAHMGEAKTFSIGFDDRSYNEVGWSERVARHLGVTHKVETIRPQVVELFDRLMQFMDDPIGDFSIFPTYLVSRCARADVTVALSGDGGDELFGGYETYVAQELARAWQRIPSFVRRGLAEPSIDRLRPRPAKKGLVNKAKRFVEGLRHDEALGHARWRLFVGEALRRCLFTEEAQRGLATRPERHILALLDAAGPRSELDRSLYVDLKSYLSDNILVKLDRMSMACSLEARVPYLDHELIELAFRLPSALKVRRGKTKVLLKKLAAKRVPPECVYRPKEGFSIPIKNWLGSEFRPLMEELLARERLASEGIFQVDVVERMKREHREEKANHSHALWALLVFEDWRTRWKV
jgi:asparagine synthase (glutamine-hydrolysing)